MRIHSSYAVTRFAVTLASVLLAALLVDSATVWAGSTAIHIAPSGPKPPKSGLRIRLDGTWVQGNGYRPVKVTLSRTGPAVSDREILVEFYPDAFSAARSVRTSRYIRVPEGVAQVTETMLVPQTREWQGMGIDIWEDGRKLEELCGTSYAGGNRQEWTEAMPKILVIDADESRQGQRTTGFRAGRTKNRGPAQRARPDLHVLANLPALPDGFPVSEWQDHLDVLSLVDMVDRIEMLPPSDIPETWLGYTCFDLIFMSHADMKTTAAEHDSRWQAIRLWGMAGGTVCVYDLEDGYEQLPRIESLCGASPLKVDADSYHGWSAPDPRVFGRSVNGFEAAENSQGRRYRSVRVTPDGEVIKESEEESDLSSPTDENGEPLFVSRAWGLGTLVAFGPAGPFPGTKKTWQYLFNSLGEERWMWYRRHGLSQSRENDGFWEFLIPGVGTAPVGAFRILITLFIVVIGPVNYYLLRRAQRLYLLFITVPVGAGLVAAGLFGYAVVADGLGARVRIRSYTHIDQQQRHAANWSRQSYYAGLAPSRGLRYPTDTAVYPLEQVPHGQYRSGWGARELHWGEQQRLQRGYIASRVTSQFVAVRSRSSNAGLRFTDGTGQNPTTLRENQLGADIKLVFLRDKRGDYLRGKDIPDGGQGPLSPTTRSHACSELHMCLHNNRPAVPKGFDPSDFREAIQFGVSQYGYWGTDYTLSRPSVATSVLEQNLRKLQGFTGESLEISPVPGSYVAIVSRPSEVPVGIEDADEVASFHVMTGTW